MPSCLPFRCFNAKKSVVAPEALQNDVSSPASLGDDGTRDFVSQELPSKSRRKKEYAKSEDRTSVHVMYCPICTYFHEEIYQSMCCSHSICEECLMDLLYAKHLIDYNTTAVPSLLPPMACPHCSGDRFQVIACAGESQAHSYEESPSTQQHIIRVTSNRAFMGVQPSPLKIGDSYEAQIKKLLTFEAAGVQGSQEFPSPSHSNNEIDNTPNTDSNMIKSDDILQNNHNNHLQQQQSSSTSSGMGNGEEGGANLAILLPGQTDAVRDEAEKENEQRLREEEETERRGVAGRHVGDGDPDLAPLQ